jgi:hypothetical protein
MGLNKVNTVLVFWKNKVWECFDVRTETAKYVRPAICVKRNGLEVCDVASVAVTLSLYSAGSLVRCSYG